MDRVDSTTVANPILWEKGIKMMLGVPLLRGDEGPRACCTSGDSRNRPFSDDDAVLLQVVADRVAGAIQTRAARDRTGGDACCSNAACCRGRCRAVRDSASRLATSPPKTHVGGDWYDLFTLPSGQLWIVVGDVAGHGLQAAVVMGRIRSALRAYTLLDDVAGAACSTLSTAR